MSASVYGRFFKSIVNALLMADVLMPDIKRRIDAMEDDTWYPWDEYIEVVSHIAAVLSPLTLRKCGINLMKQNKEFYNSIGFTKMIHQMAGFEEGFNASVKDAPAHDRVKVLESDDGHAVLRFGSAQPAALIEGYLRGSALIYDATITQLEHTLLSSPDGYTYHQFVVRWTNN
jgi:hypothetical protein